MQPNNQNLRQPTNPEDKQYEEWGVEPPVRQPHGSEVDIAQIMAMPVKHGRWVQVGNRLECRACPQAHSSPIPVEYLLKGTDEKGLPILEKLDIYKS